MDDNFVDLDLHILHETENAIKVTQDPLDIDIIDIWLPKSQIEICPEYDPEYDDEAEVSVPEWLAIEKGLL